MKSRNLGTPPLRKDGKWKYVAPEEGILRVYANNVGFAQTAFDLRLTFGQIIDASGDYPNGVLTVEQPVQITMSWLHAKILMDLLQRLIRAHEEINGTLTTPTLASPTLASTDDPVVAQKKALAN